MKNLYSFFIVLFFSFHLLATENTSFKIIDDFEDGDGMPGSFNDLGYFITNYKSSISILNGEMTFNIEAGRTDGSWSSNCGMSNYNSFGGIEIKAKSTLQTSMVIRLGKYHKATINLNNVYQTFWIPFADFGNTLSDIDYLSIGELSNASSTITIDYLSFGKTNIATNDTPTTPSNLTVYNISTNAATLQWNKAEDNDGIQNYHINIYRKGYGFDHTHIVDASATSFTDNELLPSNNYTIAVVAYDVKGNYSEAAWVDVTTQNLPNNWVMVDDFENGDGLPGSYNKLGYPIEKWKMNLNVNNGTLYLQNTENTEGSWTTYCGAKNYKQYEGIEIKAKANTNTNVLVRLGQYNTTSITLTTEYQTFWLPWESFGIDGSLVNYITIGEFNWSSSYVSLDYISIGKKGIELNDIPTPPTNLVFSNVNQNGVTLHWSAATDADGILKYKINLYKVGAGFDHSHEVMANTTSFTDLDLLPNTTYTIAVVAYDVKGNYSDAAWTEITTKSTPTLLTSYDLKESNNNGLIEYNESVKINLNISNITSINANGVVATITTLDPYLKIKDSTENYDIILKESTKSIANAFEVQVGKNVPDQHIAKIILTIKDYLNQSSIDTIEILCNAPKIIITVKNLKDENSTNHNGKIEPGESAQVEAIFKNIGHAKNTYYLWGHTASSIPSIIANTSTTGLHYIAPGDSTGQLFLFEVKPSTPVGTVGIMKIFTSNDLGFDAYDTATYFSFTVESLADVVKPSTPGNFNSSSITKTSVTLNWTASTDNNGIDHYRINAYKNGVYEKSLDANAASTSIEFTGLTPGTKYFFAIAAYDPSLNESEAAWSIEITTLSDTLPYKIVDDFDNGDGNTGSLNDLGFLISSYKASVSAYYGQMHFQMDYGRTDGSWTSGCGGLNYQHYGGIEIKAKASANTQLVISIGKYNKTTVYLSTTYQTIWIPWNSFGTDGAIVDYVMIGEVGAPQEQILIDYISIGKRGLLVNDTPSTPEATYFDVTQTNVRLLWEASLDDDGIDKYIINVYKDGIGFDHAHQVASNIFTFTDTDLTPNTAYTIAIVACDVKGNCAEPKWLWITTRPIGTLTPIVSISVNPGNTIPIGTMTTFTANPINGGSPSYQWYLNNKPVGSNSPTFSSKSLVNKDRIVVVMTSSYPNAVPKEVGSNEIIMTINSATNYTLINNFEGGDGLVGSYNDLGLAIEKWKTTVNVLNGILSIQNEMAGTSGSWTSNCGGYDYSQTGGIEIIAKSSTNTSVIIRVGQYHKTTLNLDTNLQTYWLPWSYFNSTGTSINAISIELLASAGNTIYIDQISFGKSSTSSRLNEFADNPAFIQTSAIEIYPNPLKEEGMIALNLTETANVNIDIYDIVGLKLQTVYKAENLREGTHRQPISTALLAPGIYFLVCDINNNQFTNKIIIEK